MSAGARRQAQKGPAFGCLRGWGLPLTSLVTRGSGKRDQDLPLILWEMGEHPSRLRHHVLAQGAEPCHPPAHGVHPSGFQAGGACRITQCYMGEFAAASQLDRGRQVQLTGAMCQAPSLLPQPPKEGLIPHRDRATHQGDSALQKSKQ